MFLPNSDLCFPSAAHKGLITYCQPRGRPQSSTVARQTGLSADGSARCEVCLSAAAAGGSLGTPSLRRAVKMKKRNDGRRKEVWGKKGGEPKKKKKPLLSRDSAAQTRKFVWSSFAPRGVDEDVQPVPLLADSVP